MNADEIRALDAGRELDVVVAELLFGWRWYEWKSQGWRGHAALFSPEEAPAGDGPYWKPVSADCPRRMGDEPYSMAWDDGDSPLPPYSTDRTACGAVIEWAKEHNLHITTTVRPVGAPSCICSDKITAIAHDPVESAAVCKAVLIYALRNGLVDEDKL